MRLAAILLFSLFANEAGAASLTLDGPCGTLVNVSPLDFIAGCTLDNGNGTTIGDQGGSGDSSSSSFELHISPVFMSVPIPNSDTQTFRTIFPGAPTTTSGSFIRLDGIATLFNSSSEIDLALFGYGDGNLLDSVEVDITSVGNAFSFPAADFKLLLSCPRFPCAVTLGAPMTGAGANNVTSFEEDLTVDIADGGSYSASGSPVFEGAPEPASFTLFAASLVLLARWKRRL
jgi:hypothetical protein